MSSYSYVDGKYCLKNTAKTFINDRGYQFGDAIYEVILYREGTFFDLNGHLTRLRNSLRSLDIDLKISNNSLLIIIKHLIRINKIKIASIYIQVSRGVYERDHSYINMKMKPVLVVTTKKIKNNFEVNIKGVKVITLKETRWSYPNIKTVQLLPNVLAKTEANKNDAYEAIFVDKEGYITEGSSSNIWILNKDNKLYTRNLDGSILPGITRNTVLNCANKNKFSILEKKFKIQDMLSAKEVFITSASSFVTPVIKVNETLINNGVVGEFSYELRKLYLDL